MIRRTELATAFLAALPTPVVLIFTTANDGYLTNQADLGHSIALLLPYAVATLLLTVAGWALYLGSQHRALRTLLWLFYLLGPALVAQRQE